MIKKTVCMIEPKRMRTDHMNGGCCVSSTMWMSQIIVPCETRAVARTINRVFKRFLQFSRKVKYSRMKIRRLLEGNKFKGCDWAVDLGFLTDTKKKASDTLKYYNNIYLGIDDFRGRAGNG